MSSPYFTPEHISNFNAELATLNAKYEELLLQFMSLKLENQDAIEYVNHGFLRRFRTLKRCIENVWRLCPPDIITVPSDDVRKDTEINLQSFVYNLFGCIDNLAWIWAKELQLTNENGNGKPLSGGQIGFMSAEKNRIIRKSLSQNFRNYLNGRKEWYETMIGFRHTLAHRIPLYIPPYVISPDKQQKYNELERSKGDAMKSLNPAEFLKLNKEQDELGVFRPFMTHSFSEKSPTLLFHQITLSGWNTIIEFSENLIAELHAQSKLKKERA